MRPFDSVRRPRPFLQPALNAAAAELMESTRAALDDLVVNRPVGELAMSLIDVEAELICGLVEAACRCVLPPGHTGAHECDPDQCGGAWTFDEHGEFQIVRFPGAFD